MGWFFGVVIPAIIAIFIIAEGYLQAKPPDNPLAVGIETVGFVFLIIFAFVWLRRMKRIVRYSAMMLKRVKDKEEIDSKLPRYFFKGDKLTDRLQG